MLLKEIREEILKLSSVYPRNIKNRLLERQKTHLTYSTLDPVQNSLTFMHSSVSELSLWIMVGVTLTGAPSPSFTFPMCL